MYIHTVKELISVNEFTIEKPKKSNNLENFKAIEDLSNMNLIKK